MKEIRWDPEKNEWLKRERGVSFEDMLLVGKYLMETQNPAHRYQGLMLFELDNYVWAIPYVEDEWGIFLKTLYPSRKYDRLYREGGLVS